MRAPMPCYCALPAQASAASSVQGRLPTPPSRQRTGSWETPVSTAGQPVSCVLCSRPSRNPALSPANWGGWETPVSTAGQPVSCVPCSRPSANPALSPANWGGWEPPVSTAGQTVSCVLCSRPSANPALSPANWGGWEPPVSMLLRTSLLLMALILALFGFLRLLGNL